MYARLLKYVVLFLVSAFAVSACSDDGATSPTAPAGFSGGAMLTAEPPAVDPEFVGAGSCLGFAPFAVRVIFVARPTQDVVIRSARFHFLDRFGVRTVPAVMPLQMTPSALPANSFSTPIPIPSSSPIPIPGTSPIPIPGVSEFDPLLIARGSSRSLRFLVQFGCGVRPEGTVFVDFNVSDRRGRPLGGNASVRVR